MYKQLIFIVLVFFIIFNIYKYNKEHFSNTYQDTELESNYLIWNKSDEKKPLRLFIMIEENRIVNTFMITFQCIMEENIILNMKN